MKNEYTVTKKMYQSWLITAGFHGRGLLMCVSFCALAALSMLMVLTHEFEAYSVLYIAVFLCCIYTAFFKNAEDFLKFLQKFFERTKCARPKSPDGRIGIVSSIQMIRQFIYISVVSPGGGRAFFDKSITVGFCRYAFCFMAATSFSRRFQQ